MDCGCVSKSVVGTELKFALSLSLPGSLTMDDVDFTASFYIYQGRSVDVPKAEMAKQDSDTYICVVDSSRLRSGGEVKCQVEVQVPDSACTDGIRTEIVTIHTGEYLVHGLRSGNIGQA